MTNTHHIIEVCTGKSHFRFQFDVMPSSNLQFSYAHTLMILMVLKTSGVNVVSEIRT